MIGLFDKFLKKDQQLNKNNFTRVSSNRQSIIKNENMIWSSSSSSNNNNNNLMMNNSKNYSNTNFFNDTNNLSTTADQLLIVRLNDLNKPREDDLNTKITLGIHVIPAYDLNTNR
jgi:hypothetical protein